MAVSEEVKSRTIRQIKVVLEKYGDSGTEVSELQKSLTDVPRNSFYRWTRDIKNSGLQLKNTARNIKEIDIEKGVSDNLPVNITPDHIGARGGYLSVVDQIGKCVIHADNVLAQCEDSKGKIRNPKLYLQASKHILEAMKTASYISNQLMEAQKVEQFHQAILAHLKARDPELVELILMDLEQLNKDWGII